MADVTNLVLPDDIKPRDGRFGCGPSKVRLESLAALAASGTSLMDECPSEVDKKQLDELHIRIK